MIAVLCAAIQGVELLRDRLPEAGADRAAERCRKRIRLAAESYAGCIAGDEGGRLSFGFANSADAFQAAVIIQQRVLAMPAMAGIKLAVRVGIGSMDGLQGKPETLAASLADLASPGQVLFCVEPAEQQEMPSGRNLAVRPLPDRSLEWGGTRLGVCEIDWRSNRALASSRQAAHVVDRGGRLVIRYGGKEIVMDDRRTQLTIGRGLECDVILLHPRTSRRHARIERRGRDFVVTDLSSNGTYVLLDGQQELCLRRRELILLGSGQLSFAAPVAMGDGDKAYFRV